MQILKGEPHSLKKTYNVGCYLLEFFGGCAPRPRTIVLLGLTKIKIPWPKSFRKFLNSHGVNRKWAVFEDTQVMSNRWKDNEILRLNQETLITLFEALQGL